MHHRNIRAVAALTTLTLLAACSDARLDKLALGMSPDSAAKVIGDTPHRTNAYLTGGKQWAVQFYARGFATEKDSIPWRKMSPVVFIDGKAVGWGWGWWNGAAKKSGIGMPR
jgi:hypothetical protein